MVISDEIAAAVRAHPNVHRVDPSAHGPATEFTVVAEDFGLVAAGLPVLVAPFDPLAAQWDRLSDYERYLIVVSGPAKIDLNFPDVPRSWPPPWRIGPDTLAAVDAHFWDWSLWLVGKRRHGKPDRVLGELLKMSQHLLIPLGVKTVPADLRDAADRYVRARDRLEERYGLQIPRRLEAEIRPLIHSS